MATKATGKRGPQGRPGPAGPSGHRGTRGTRGARGAMGRPGARGKVGPIGAAGDDNRTLVKALDAEVHGIYRELSAHMDHLVRVQRQLDEMRKAIKRLGASIKD